MDFHCRICGNAENNRLYKMREMMFGMRDEFDYIECGACGTIQICEIPDLRRYYPKEYYSFASNEDFWFTKQPRSRLVARLAGACFVNGWNLLGKYLSEKEAWVNSFFPASLKEPLLKINFRSRILDFGCGSGRLLQILYHFGFRNLTGADAFIEKDIVYSNGIAIYKKTLDELSPAFDLVMLHHSFEHLPNPLETLREIIPLLEPNRFCLIRIPLVNFAWEKYRENWAQLDPPRHLFLYPEKSFRSLAERAGFEVVKVVYDSESFQFWASEQYLRDIPLTDERGYNGDVSKSIFSAEQIAEWQKQSEQLNDEGRGDQACFYLQKRIVG